MKAPSLGARLALLFAACTAAVSLVAGVLFNRASEAHFIELDQQLLEDRLAEVRAQLGDAIANRAAFDARKPALLAMLARQPDLALRVASGTGEPWLDTRPDLPSTTGEGLSTLHSAGADYRALISNVDGETITLLLDITHHQHFLQRMQRLIWLTVGLSALATALLGAWAARRGLQPLHRMQEIASRVGARSLTTRLPDEAMPAELADLARSFNAMFERLDDAFQRLSAFSSDIAHELRTPLSNLLTHTQVTLTQQRTLEEYREALHGNLEELQWMSQLVNDMLFLAKAEHGLLLPNRQRLNLADELDALLEYFALSAEENGCTIRREGRGMVEGDRTMLRRAFSNLLDNALRFTPSGGEIVLALEVQGASARVEVRNSGAPQEARHLDRLFDRFYRGDPARHEGHGEHAGLGLAITRSIIHAHGGRIQGESSDGWTRFVIELPAHS